MVADSFAANEGTSRIYVWITSAFALAFQRHGYSCDICGEIITVADGALRTIADRALANLDGLVKLCLCKDCSSMWSSFCKREFERETAIPYDDDLEKMMLAYIAWRIKCLARSENPHEMETNRVRAKGKGKADPPVHGTAANFVERSLSG